MTKKPENPPAFPNTFHRGSESAGMSLRDYFAGQTLQGMYANASFDEVTKDVLASVAYAQADTMLAAREGKDL